MPFAKINSVNIYYEVHGQGDPVIFINGNHTSTQGWMFQLQEFKKHFQVILYDHRDQGRSESPEDDYDINQFVEDLKSLMDVLEIEQANIVGISHGSSICQRFAVKYPERVKKLVMLGAMSEFSPGIKYIYDTINELIRDGELKNVFKMLSILAFSEKSFDLIVDQMPLLTGTFVNTFKEKIPSMVRISEVAYQHFPFTQELEKIKAPTLLITGMEDKLTPVSRARIIIKKIQDCQLKILKGCGHALHKENPAKVNKLILEFINN